MCFGRLISPVGSEPVKEREPISKYLVSHELSLDDRTDHIRELLASRQEQEQAKTLEPGDASKFVELLDEVRSFILPPLNQPPVSEILTRGSRF